MEAKLGVVLVDSMWLWGAQYQYPDRYTAIDHEQQSNQYT
jgi:hypothetical protein